MPFLKHAVLIAVLFGLAADGEAAPPLATISLHNPGAATAPSVVELPTGSLAAPGLINWAAVHLECDGQTIPFALREGRAHWRARLDLPILAPRPEDLLVFSIAVPPGAWKQVELHSGAQAAHTAMEQSPDRITVAYPGARIEIDPRDGRLLSYQIGNVSILKSPFQVLALPGAPGYTLKGSIAVGYTHADVELAEQAAAPLAQPRQISTSTAACTEIHFIYTSQQPECVLSYRLHANGQLDILVDERPWARTTPWANCQLRCDYAIQGTAHEIPELQNRLPFYGFRDYAAVVKSLAQWHDLGQGGVLELGTQIINGRQFARKFIPCPADDAGARTVAELADEGLVLKLNPLRSTPLHGPIHFSGVHEAAIDLLSGSLESLPTTADALTFRMEGFGKKEAEASGLEGDGFSITQPEENVILLRAATWLGFYNAAQAMQRHFQRDGVQAGIPLIARNPVVDFRAGGFGGGNFEVDFPYGTDEEWQHALDGMLDSGMNIFGCLGMWSNWKMPVTFRYLPELQSADAADFDEATGANFAETATQREHGLKLLKYIQDRGAKVWLWLPIGCVPTTFPEAFPEAMAQGSDKVPCPTHPDYQRYLDAFLRELLETYPVDGFVMIRDDNGGICSCERCTAYEKNAATGNRVWQQFTDIHGQLRALGFKGGIGAYPYNDPYVPALEAALPEDLVIMGHGAGLGLLTRRFDRVAPMGDTWLDNLYANFRLPPAPRMRRLLADRPSFWIGGACTGTELPWEAPGFYGWEPTATPNTQRYDWGFRTFGEAGALPFLRMSNAYEALWDINAHFMTPGDWVRATEETRTQAASSARGQLTIFRQHLQELKQSADATAHARWFAHLDLFAPFIEYHLKRLENFSIIHQTILSQRETIARGESLPPDLRTQVLSLYQEIYASAAPYAAAMQQAPAGVRESHAGMLDHCRWMVAPYKEWMAGYDEWLDPLLGMPQFAGTATLSTTELQPGQPFELKLELRNEGICPWIGEAAQRIELSGDAEKLGLPAAWTYTGAPMAPGDRRTITLPGNLPQESAQAQIEIKMTTPFRTNSPFLSAQLALQW